MALRALRGQASGAQLPEVSGAGWDDLPREMARAKLADILPQALPAPSQRQCPGPSLAVAEGALSFCASKETRQDLGLQ